MKRLRVAIIAVVLCLLGIIGVLIMRAKNIDKRGVKYNGWLQVDGANIVNKHGKQTQLVGVSSHGIQWFGDLYTTESLTHLKNDLGINVFRIAMYTNPDEGGYVGHHELRDKVYELVDDCIALDMYVIVDWHILNDNNPQTHKAEALEFFGELSEKYGDTPNVIYEICNEPNGDVDWNNDVRPYEEEVIAKIRGYAPKALVLAGIPDWGRDLIAASRNPLDDKNVAYAFHFYAGSHNKIYRDNIDDFREKGLAVFVSECGATDATGDGKVYDEAFVRWTDFMNEKGISWVYWSYSNKDEASAMLKKDAEPSFESEESTINEYLSPSGELFERETAFLRVEN